MPEWKAVTNEKGEITGYTDPQGTFFRNTRSLEAVPAGKQTKEFGKGVQEVEQIDTSSIVPGFNLRAFLESGFPEAILTGVGSESTRQLTRNLTGTALKTGARIASPFLAGMFTDYAASQARAALPQEMFKYEPNKEPSLGTSANRAFIDRLFGRGGEAIAGTHKLATKGLQNTIFDKLGEKFAKPKTLNAELLDSSNFAARFGIPDRAYSYIEGRIPSSMEAMLSQVQRNELTESFAKAESAAIKDITKGRLTGELTGQPTSFDLAKRIQNSLFKQRDKLQKNADNLWSFAKTFGANSNYTAAYEDVVTVPARSIPNSNGIGYINVPAQTQTVLKDKVINEPIDIGKIKEYSTKINEELKEILQQPADFYASNPPMQTAVNNIKKELGNLSSIGPDMNSGRFLMARKNSEELRQVFTDAFRHASGQDKERLAGISKTLRGLLSEAEDKSIGDTSLGWQPGSGAVFRSAKNATKALKSAFGHGTTTKKLTTNVTPSDYRTLEPEVELEILDSLKSAESVNRLIDSGAEPSDVNSLFVLQGWKKAINRDGTLDGDALHSYFYDNSTNESILKNSKLFNSDQRDVIRLLTNHAKHGKLSGKTGQAGWLDTRIMYSALSAPTSLLAAAKQGYIPPQLGMAGTFLTLIPFGRASIANLMLSKEGAKLLRKRLYPTSPQQSMKTSAELLRLLPRGEQVFVMGQNSNEKYPATVDENGKLVFEPPEEPNQ